LTLILSVQISVHQRHLRSISTCWAVHHSVESSHLFSDKPKNGTQMPLIEQIDADFICADQRASAPSAFDLYLLGRTSQCGVEPSLP
jgi:hypothetical protein